MGNPTRCPVCNRFGTVELNGFCKACYVNPNSKEQYAKIKIYSRTDPTVVSRALLEVGLERVADIQPEHVGKIYNIIKRRLPNRKHGNIVKDSSPMQEYGYDFKSEEAQYKMEKGVCDYERRE